MKKQVLISGIAAIAALTASAQPCSWGFQMMTQLPVNPYTIQFTQQTTGTPPPSIYYDWTISNGTTTTYTSSGISNSMIYAFCEPGTYTVACMGADSLNPSCTASMQTVVTITATPFSLTSINVNASNDPTFSFTANVNNPNSLSLSYNWDFEYPNGNYGSGNPTSHTYGFNGNYVVSVDVSGAGCTKTATTSISVTNACGVVLPVLTVISNNDPSFTFSVSANPAPSSNATYQWSFGDGNILTTNVDSTTYTYTSNGAYNVCVFITDSSSACTYSAACVPVNVSNVGGGGGGNGTLTCSLNINFTPDSANANVWYYNYSGASSDPNATVSYLWNFGDGNTSTQAFPTHTYSAVGNYSVCLTITYTDSTDTCVVSSCGYISNAQFLYKVGTPLGIKDINSIVNLIVFPNPSHDVLFITSPVNMNGSIQIIDITGREIIHKDVENVTRIEINTSALNNGTYFLKYKDSSGNDLTKMIIKN